MKLNLPNKLTVFRIILIPFFVLFIVYPVFGSDNLTASRIVAAAIFIIAAITDFFDGNIARKRGLVTTFGKFMDPLADKFLIIGALLAALPVYEAFEWALVVCLLIIIFRELAVSSMRLIAKNAEGLVIAAALPGKIKTFSQCIFVLLLLLEEYVFAFSDFFVTYRPLTWTCMAVMVFFTIYSGIQYFHVYKRFIFDA